MNILKGFTEEKIYQQAVSLKDLLEGPNEKKKLKGFTVSLVYQNCFSGKSCVTLFQQELKLKNREDALELAQIFMEKGYVLHASSSNSKVVDNEQELYKFCPDIEKVYSAHSKHTAELNAKREQQLKELDDEYQQRRKRSLVMAQIAAGAKQGSVSKVAKLIGLSRKQSYTAAPQLAPMNRTLAFQSSPELTPITPESSPFNTNTSPSSPTSASSSSSQSLSSETSTTTAASTAAPHKRTQAVFEQMTVWDVLQDEEARQLFKKFAKEEYSAENVEFWEQVQHWKALSLFKDKQEMKCKIFSLFILSDSLYSLNLSSTVRKQLEKIFQQTLKASQLEASEEERLTREQIDELDQKLFQTALRHVESDLMDTMGRFKFSEMWVEYCKAQQG